MWFAALFPVSLHRHAERAENSRFVRLHGVQARVVHVGGNDHVDGQESHTVFELKQAWRDFSLLRAELKTGRTHQIRVHLAHLGFPIAGDDKYGDFELNKELARNGLKRMRGLCLHGLR